MRTLGWRGVSRAVSSVNRGRGGRQLQEAVQVDAALDEIGQPGPLVVGQAPFSCRHQPQVAFGQRHLPVVGEGADDWRPAPSRDGVPDPAGVRSAPDAVRDHRGKIHLRVERLESEHNGRRAAGLSLGIDDEDDGSVQPLRYLGRRSLVTDGVKSIEAAHHSLDDGQIDVGGLPGNGREHMIAPAHPPIEVVGASAGDHLVEPRVDEVRADLKTLDGEPAAAERFQQAKRDRGLSHPARYAGNHDKARRSHARTLASAGSHCKDRHAAGFVHFRVSPFGPSVDGLTHAHSLIPLDFIPCATPSRSSRAGSGIVPTAA